MLTIIYTKILREINTFFKLINRIVKKKKKKNFATTVRQQRQVCRSGAGEWASPGRGGRACGFCCPQGHRRITGATPSRSPSSLPGSAAGTAAGAMAFFLLAGPDNCVSLPYDPEINVWDVYCKTVADPGLLPMYVIKRFA